MPFFFLVLVGFSELWLLAQVGRIITFPMMILLVVATTLLGSFCMRFASTRARVDPAGLAASGGDPVQALEGVVAWLLGGVLLLLPGFITDVLGLSLLFPPTRLLWRRVLRARLQRGLGGATGGVDLGSLFGSRGAGPTGSRPAPRAPADGRVLDADYEVLE